MPAPIASKDTKRHARPMMLSHSRRWDKLGTKLRLITQNFNGLKTDDTLDIITNTMEKHDIDIFVAQETWRHGKERESESIVVNDAQIFLHGTVDQDPKKREEAKVLQSSYLKMPNKHGSMLENLNLF